MQDLHTLENASHQVVNVEKGEIRFTALDISIVCSLVAYLADIMSRHHQPVIVNKLDEGLAGHQLIEAIPVADLNVLQVVDGLHQPLQRFPAVDGAGVIVRLLGLFRSGAEAIQVPEGIYVLEVVKVSHINPFSSFSRRIFQSVLPP